ncbi:hypothetical protein [Micromonospora aurantiaca (nom. illeg.)]|uniref:hypothetical protein n=1 Tax=Micromonospora aurantiaca (nom. illeg.) TaxID=47850 RepID=UPI003F4A4F15
MQFGLRLPGPFRVGVSSRGRANVGVALGPVSVSTGGSRGAAVGGNVYPIGLDDAVTQLVAAGWRVTGGDGERVLLARGWRALHVEAVEGGVTWWPVTSRRTVIAWTLVLLAVLALCLWQCG